MILRPLIAIIIAASAVGLGILALMHWREVGLFLLVTATAWWAWQLKWLLLGVLGLGWLLGGDDCDL
ncbi:MAG: hypothetical protein ACT4QA_07135 [Panacagrimonas sp.]